MRLGNKDISLGYVGKKAIQIIKVGLLTAWEAIRSCYGNGYWDNDKPWDNDDAWSN